jgi:hypothetical protein
MRNRAVGLWVVLLTIGCSAQVAVSTPGPTPTEQPSPTPTDRPTVQPTPSPTPAPITANATIGEPVTITCSGENCLEITVTEVKFVSLFADPAGFYNDEPQTPGNVFMQAYVTYLSLKDAARYNPFDWSVFVADRAVDQPAFVIHGPKPPLGSGDLPNGRSAAGWILYEVAPTGKVVLSYAPNFNGPPVFEVVVRDS